MVLDVGQNRIVQIIVENAVVGAALGILCIGGADKNMVPVPPPIPLTHSFAAGAAFDKAGEDRHIPAGVLPLSAQDFGVGIVKYFL